MVSRSDESNPMIGYRKRDSFTLALLKGAILEIEQPATDLLHKIGHFAGGVYHFASVIYPPEPRPDAPSPCVVHGPLCR